MQTINTTHLPRRTVADGFQQTRQKSVPLWWIRLTNYEYWPWLVLYIPVLPIWLWNALRTRSLTYFTAINPGWKEGGFYGVGKKAILDLVPAKYKPQTTMVSIDEEPTSQILGFEYPLIAKPDMGERGNGVAKIHTIAELIDYHRNSPQNYIVQEYVSYKTELGILYSRMPGSATGMISSVTLKAFLSVTGDGVHTLEQLVLAQDRARFQAPRLKEKYSKIWYDILAQGQKLELESIGNHCRGTRFINANYLINPQLNQVFDHIANQIPGLQYGRYDLRVANIDDLYQGKNIRIVELNGVNADPAHIYDNRHGLFHTFKDLVWHWLRIGDIAKHNLRQGIHASGNRIVWKNLKERNF